MEGAKKHFARKVSDRGVRINPEGREELEEIRRRIKEDAREIWRPDRVRMRRLF